MSRRRGAGQQSGGLPRLERRRGSEGRVGDHRAVRDGDQPVEPAWRLSAMYDAFNERDILTATDQMAVDVDWPKAWEPGRARGRAALRDYWQRMWAAVDVKLEPLGFTPRPDGTIAVEVRRVVRDLDGRLLDDRRAVHVYVLAAGLVARMDVEESDDTG